jgi:putative oxidoreductase
VSRDIKPFGPAWAPYLLSAVRILAGILFVQHGAEKLWGFAGGRIEHDFTTLRGFAGPLEIVGGPLIALGLFTRATAFILCGEMAVAYFRSWAPRGFWPISNGGEEAVIFCYFYLYLVAAGAGPWSLDAWIRKNASRASDIWEHRGRSLLRIIFAFTFTLHGYRHVFGLFRVSAGRRAAIPMALDGLPPVVGYWEIAGGLLLLAGLLTRPAALISSAGLLAAYLYSAAPRGVWPVRNGGNEALLYLAVFLYLAAAGPGRWSIDRLVETRRRPGARIGSPAAAAAPN